MPHDFLLSTSHYTKETFLHNNFPELLWGGRDLPEKFTFKTFSDWIRHALEEELERSWEIEMNGTGVPEAYAPAAG